MGLLLYSLLSSLVSEIWEALTPAHTLVLYSHLSGAALGRQSMMGTTPPKAQVASYRLCGSCEHCRFLLPHPPLWSCTCAPGGSKGEAVNLMILLHFLRDLGELEGRRGKI